MKRRMSHSWNGDSECSEDWYDLEWPGIGVCLCRNGKAGKYETCEQCFLEGALDVSEDSDEDPWGLDGGDIMDPDEDSW